MAFSHRKLFTDPIYEQTSQFCKPFCDPLTNPQGFCPISCFSICITNCHHKIIPLLPPPIPEISTPPDYTSHHHKLSHPLLIFLFILVTVFSLFLILTLIKFLISCYRCRARQRSSRTQETDSTETRDQFLDEEHGPVVDHPIWYIRTIGLQASVISAITICKYKKGEGLVEGTECSVCLNEFQENESLRLLPKCNHAFHLPCIDTWLRSHTNCPLCRAGIVSNVAVELPVLRSIGSANANEDTQDGILLSNEEEGTSELGEPEGENGVKIIEEMRNFDLVEETNEVLQGVRRSVSMDFLSTSCDDISGDSVRVDGKCNDSNTSNFVRKGFDVNERLMRIMGSSGSSSGSSMQNGGNFLMKRSYSSSGKVLFPRQSKNFVPPS